MESLLPDAAPDFSDPLGLLKACHQRILGYCELLEKLVAHVAENGVDDEAKKAAQQVYRYFSTAGILHHLDEEQDVFPILIRSSIKVAEIIHGLKKDHEAIHVLWTELAPLLEQPQTIADAENFPVLVEQYCQAYRNHIRTEENDFLSIAEHMLSSEQLSTIGKNMKERRKVPE
jgi:hemerythrin-like domain-containing protein